MGIKRKFNVWTDIDKTMVTYSIYVSQTDEIFLQKPFHFRNVCFANINLKIVYIT